MVTFVRGKVYKVHYLGRNKFKHRYRSIPCAEVPTTDQTIHVETNNPHAEVSIGL